MKMENKRYNFGGFTFGSNGLFQLTIKTINHQPYGTNTNLELGIELTPEELQELITVLLTKKDTN
jgi:hypothetical protein